MENKKCVKIRKQTAWLKTYVKMVTIIKLTKSIHVLEKGFLKNSQCIKYSTFDSIIPSSFTTILCTERLEREKKLNSYTRSTIGRDKVTDENFCIFFYTLHPSRSHTTGLALGSQFKQSSTWFYTRSGCVHSNITYCIIKVLKPETFSNVSNHTNPELKC